MRPGDVIADRFEILRLAGKGGMGHVYEARDREGGARVALKVLRDRGAHESERFAREARVLAGLRHPGVVRYVAHGSTDEGAPYLVMEWLEGETLAERLYRVGLAVPESIALARQLAVALGAVHRAGVVHRDLKPSNVFLVGGDVDHALLIDFGVARAPGGGPRITSTGVMVGTPGYMAPEQARGEPDIDARTDVFALGCVLFKCLTGRDAFAGDSALSILLKVVMEAPPRAGELRDGIPADLDDLLERWTAKPRRARPIDGDAAAAELDALDPAPIDARRTLRPGGFDAREITTNERKLMCLLLVQDVLVGSPALRAAAHRHRGRVEALGRDVLAVIFSDAGAPTDLAARAARCALAVCASIGAARASLVTGLTEIEEHMPVGELIDRAVYLLAPGSAASIRVDEVTSSLLGPRFELRPEVDGFGLVRELDVSEPAPLLLGRPTGCVGRDREIVMLESAFARAAEDGSACAVLVTGAPGAGKSRLRHEMFRRLRARDEPFTCWLGHGDPMSAGSSFGLLSRALRHAIGLGEADPIEERRAAIRGRAHPLDDAERVAAFLGELVGAPFPDEESSQLRAARRDPVLMGDQVRRAAEDLLRAACVEGPVLLVLEDLHWGDLPTVTFVDAALRNLADMPLLVLALARPEVHEVFPKLWASRAVQIVQLGELPRRAAERLVKQALGDATAPDRVKAIVDRSGGNAFYLEELIRAAALGRGDDLPATVLAMAQARLETFDAEARRVLRAASIFGATFTQGGVEALLGGVPVGHRLAELVEGEVIARRVELSGPANAEYGFRHALVREAAYGMFTQGDRAVGHALAGAWLERVGKGDSMALAEHFERGGEPARAAAWYRRAAEQALEGDDLVAAIDRAARSAACGASGVELGAARLVEAEAHLWRGDLARAEERANEAAALLAPGGIAWLRALTHAANAAAKLGAFDRVEAAAALVGAAEIAEDAGSARGVVLCSCSSALALGGRQAAADACLAQVDSGGPPALDTSAMGRLHEARACRAMCAGDPGACLAGFDAALDAFTQTGDRRNACSTRGNIGFLFVELGDAARAEEVLRAALADAERMGLHQVTPAVLQNLGHAVARAGRLDEARVLLDRAVDLFHAQGDGRMESAALGYLAQVALLSNDAVAAERDARAAAELVQELPSSRAQAVAVLARALLRQGRTAEALAAAEEAFALLEASGGTLEDGEALVRLVHAEALAAAGRGAEADLALALARDRLHARASLIADPAWRERFLTAVPENAATLCGAL